MEVLYFSCSNKNNQKIIEYHKRIGQKKENEFSRTMIFSQMSTTYKTTKVINILEVAPFPKRKSNLMCQVQGF